MRQSNSKIKTAVFVLDLLKKSGSFLYLSDIQKRLTSDLKDKDDFVRPFLSLFKDKGFFSEKGAKNNLCYRLIGDYDLTLEAIKETYADDGEKLPADVEIYYNRYGFDKLVASVSKWINHENTLEREYDIDRLWIGRYIDFLDKAKEYLSWLKADQAIARKKLADIKNHNNKNNNSNK